MGKNRDEVIHVFPFLKIVYVIGKANGNLRVTVVLNARGKEGTW